MNYMEFLESHEKSGAAVSIAVQPVTRMDASQFGILKTDEQRRIVKFMEKPKTEEALSEMMNTASAQSSVKKDGEAEEEEKPFLASMGIYCFNTEELERLLSKDLEQTDFGKHIIPDAIGKIHVNAFPFDGYWADIGTVKSFYEANMDLVSPCPKFSLFDLEMPIYTNTRYIPSARLVRSFIENAIVGEGAIIEGAVVHDSIIGVRTSIRPGATVDASIIMGADFYASPDFKGVKVGIGAGAHLKKAIVDKNACIGNGAQLLNRNNVQEYEDPKGMLFVRDGVIVIAKNAIIPDGFRF
jgi:glucose-1-phosphate adenylyltransferase